MNRNDLTDATRDALKATITTGMLDACDVLALGAECNTPCNLLDTIVEIVAAHQHEREWDTARKTIVRLCDLAYMAEIKAGAQRIQRAL